MRAWEQVVLFLGIVFFVKLSSAIPLNDMGCEIPEPGTKTIAAPADLETLASCETVTGSIAIHKDLKGDLSINEVKEITGSLTAIGAHKLDSLSADSLESLGDFELNDLSQLSTLAFPKLSSVGEISWNYLPALGNLTFATEITRARSIYIRNTFLSSVDGINPITVKDLLISDNSYFKDITFPTTNITGLLSIQDNAELAKFSFPELISASDIALRDLGNISMPVLTTIQNNLNITRFGGAEISLPHLASVGPLLAISDCPNLSKISLPELWSTRGDFEISGNPKIASLSFPKFSEAGMNIRFQGNFSSVDLPNLSSVQGDVNLISDKTLNCSDLLAMQKSGAINGNLYCSGDAKASTPHNNNTNNSNSSNDHKNSSSSNSATIVKSVMGSCVSLAAVLVLLSLWTRAKHKKTLAKQERERAASRNARGVEQEEEMNTSEMGRLRPRTPPRVETQSIAPSYETQSVLSFPPPPYSRY
ncbi:uncharacterized protein K452DRAFT_357347 [Aplosporella prunicola CBS 121167]|uniref:Receptor L-domain domain-containing protein n=1 Tax=Aplosporella prunicola CBS 121167 TaxID=1176127 RepID=A0A6A6BHU7_9PEZI|nr:uncharacterized protein K452DRAFT_357347 [Aplosporella prunicola CBS 121167]KAF2143719.1 hypothetical protein K452DRAFT_357347 [Aplosporella prunicola CBS 121167]